MKINDVTRVADSVYQSYQRQDENLTDNIQHTGSGDTGVAGNGCKADAQHRHDETKRRLDTIGRQDVQINCKDQDQEQTDDKFRHGLEEHGYDQHQRVYPGVLLQGR